MTATIRATVSAAREGCFPLSSATSLPMRAPTSAETAPNQPIPTTGGAGQRNCVSIASKMSFPNRHPGKGFEHGAVRSSPVSRHHRSECVSEFSMNQKCRRGPSYR
jgi:hypothetical protein